MLGRSRCFLPVIVIDLLTAGTHQGNHAPSFHMHRNATHSSFVVQVRTSFAHKCDEWERFECWSYSSLENRPLKFS